MFLDVLLNGFLRLRRVFTQGTLVPIQTATSDTHATVITQRVVRPEDLVTTLENTHKRTRVRFITPIASVQ